MEFVDAPVRERVATVNAVDLAQRAPATTTRPVRTVLRDYLESDAAFLRGAGPDRWMTIGMLT